MSNLTNIFFRWVGSTLQLSLTHNWHFFCLPKKGGCLKKPPLRTEAWRINWMEHMARCVLTKPDDVRLMDTGKTHHPRNSRKLGPWSWNCWCFFDKTGEMFFCCWCWVEGNFNVCNDWRGLNYWSFWSEMQYIEVTGCFFVDLIWEKDKLWRVFWHVHPWSAYFF